jgi:hypothetical protein
MGLQMRTNTEEKTTDRSALLMMLAYVEAECRRMGADAAAQHAAMAAALVPGQAVAERALGFPLH